MLKFKKCFIFIVLVMTLFMSSVLATDTTPVTLISEDVVVSVQEPNSTTNAYVAETLNQDLYIYGVDNYTLSDIVNGNIFASTLKFTTNPKNNGGIVSGDLFVLSSDVIIGSDVIYSDSPGANGKYSINSINSKSVIKGNVYAFSENFTLEAGSEIQGNLYIYSTNVNINQDAVIKGNVYIFAIDVNLNGQVSGSAYITTNKFNMDYLGYINRDLYLNTDNASLSGVIYRNAFITAKNELLTTSYFRVDQNLSVDYANNFKFSGEIKQDAFVNVKNLSFNNSENEKCIIRGNLNYATQNEVTIPEGVVSGEKKSADFVNIYDDSFSLEETMFSLFMLLVYVFAVVFFCKRFTPKALDAFSALNIKNALISFLVGFTSLFGVILATIFLLISGVGLSLALVLVVAFMFVCALALPFLLYTIANMLKFKLNLYVKLLIVTSVFYIVTLLPVIGSPLAFITIFAGVGRILLSLFSKKK